MQRGALLWLPNLVSLSRLALAAAFVLASGITVRVTLIVAAGATDFLDGWIARRHNLSSRPGAVIDPVADRVFVFIVIVTYVVAGALSTMQAIALLLRDIATSVAWLLSRRLDWLGRVEYRARRAGKVVTVFQMATLLVVLLAPRLVNAFVLVVAALSAWAIADYAALLWRAKLR
ncbi:MAG: CDP-alcohol phosphatidyltransferase family protein [Gemmatimonadaceae bacterium]